MKRRHHNTKGVRQVRRGKTRTQVERIAKRLGIPYGDTEQSGENASATVTGDSGDPQDLKNNVSTLDLVSLTRILERLEAMQQVASVLAETAMTDAQRTACQSEHDCLQQTIAILRTLSEQVTRLEGQFAETHTAWNAENERRHDAEARADALAELLAKVQGSHAPTAELALQDRISHLVAELASLKVAAEDLVRRWWTEAKAIHADGDYCCAKTREHDASELNTVLQCGADETVARLKGA